MVKMYKERKRKVLDQNKRCILIRKAIAAVGFF
jgi:hypothetical protein